MQDAVLVPVMTYALALADGRFYVGKTFQLNMRWSQHVTGHGARFTRKYKPEKIIRVEAGDHERAITLELMREHGWELVRGGPWTKVIMNYPPKELRSS